MTITIAGKQFSTRKPKELEATLVATTGCSAAENLRIISGQPLPGRVAAAIAPFLPDEQPSLSELAGLIEKDLATPGTTLLVDAQKLFTAADVQEAKEGQ